MHILHSRAEEELLTIIDELRSVEGIRGPMPILAGRHPSLGYVVMVTHGSEVVVLTEHALPAAPSG